MSGAPGQNVQRTFVNKNLSFNHHSTVVMLALTAAVLAQLVEHVTAKHEVEGSISEAGPILRVLK